MSSSSLKSTLKVQKELLLIQDSSGVICKKSPSCRGKHQISICRPTVTQGKPCLPGGGTTFIQIVPVGKLTVDMSRHISQISLLINVWEMLRALSWARRINDVFFFLFFILFTHQTCSFHSRWANMSPLMVDDNAELHAVHAWQSAGFSWLLTLTGVEKYSALTNIDPCVSDVTQACTRG